jgi:hypothetical protein
MTEEIKDICALCKHFKMKEYPKHAEVGLGRCTGYDGTATPLIKPFHSWSTKACTRFRQDWATTPTREAWIAKQRSKQQDVQTETKG